jgi:hypothetical protein
MMNLAHPSRWIQPTLSLFAGLSLVLSAACASAQTRGEKEDPLLSPDDIELIKVFEVHLDTDPKPRVTIPRDELRNFLKDFQEDDRIPRGKREQEDWLRSDGYKQLELLFQLRARDYYKHVRVRSQIESLREFGNIHRRYILGFFQPVFGSGAVEGLYLFPRGRDAERIEMTNFYILTQVSIDGKPIIDRNQPEDSLLVQWGLPRESAKFPAPEEIKGWENQFKSEDDERFKELVSWIESLIAANQDSNYGISYKMPQHKKNRN